MLRGFGSSRGSLLSSIMHRLTAGRHVGCHQTPLDIPYITLLEAIKAALSSLHHHVQEGGDEDALVGLAVKAIEALAEVGNACGDRLLLGSEVDAGQGLGSGELPAAQAAILYVLRVGVIEQMGETGQVSH